jgi:hypothetical protein
MDGKLEPGLFEESETERLVMFEESCDLRKLPCPSCQRKGLHFDDHPHAFGWKDYNRVVCRFCGVGFKPKPEPAIDYFKVKPSPEGDKEKA